MSTMVIGGALALAVTGCGGARPAPAPEPARDPAGCDAVARHLVELAERDNAVPAPGDVRAGMHAELARQCHDAPWSPARRLCLLAAPTQDDTATCPQQ